MAWQDRLREAAYTPPSGTRLVFYYEDVAVEYDKKTAAFDFPDADGTYIQDLGATSRRYPLRMFFWGDDYDLQAVAFENALQERGIGRLEHPIYGAKDVVPFGLVRRRDDLKTAANQATFEVVFWETTGLVYPTTQADPASEVEASIEAYNDSAASQFEGSVWLTSVSERVSLRSSYLALLDGAKSGLGVIAEVQDNVRRQFQDIVDSINLGIDVLVADPLSLAYQTSLLLQTPALAAADINARLSAYKALANSLITGDGAVVTQGFDAREANGFHTRDLFASGYVSGALVSAINTQFETKTQALAAAEDILAQFEAVATWRDDNYESLAEVDTGAAYQQLQQAVALTAGFLVFISFSLKQERKLTLDRARTIVDLVAELYGEVDGELDFFITSNELTGDEILELPAGREVVYYV